MIDKNCCKGNEDKIKECQKHEPWCQSGEHVCPYFNEGD